MSSKTWYTSMGILALLFWSSNTYLYKMTIEKFGYFSGNCVMYCLAGLIGLTVHLTFIKQYTKLNYNTLWIYLLLNINNICISLAFAFAKIGSELLQITIINYLWTITTYVALIYFLNYKIKNKILFGSAILSAIFGICITCIGFNFDYLKDFFLNVQNNWYCYLFALGVVFSWSFYSVYIKKYSNEIKDDHIYISFLISGLFFLMLSFVFPKYKNWKDLNIDHVSIFLLLYEALIAILLPYYLWNIGYKHGDELTISRFSLLSPILNISFTSLFYGLSPYINIFVGAILLTTSAYLCKVSTELDTNNNNNSNNDNNDLDLDLDDDNDTNDIESHVDNIDIKS